MADNKSSHGRHRRNPPKQSKIQFVIPFVALAMLIGFSAHARGTNQAAPTLTPTVVETIAPSPTKTNLNGPYLTFATWNIAKPANSAVPKWGKRREAIRKTISDSYADVIAVQEANFAKVIGDNGKTLSTWQDVQALAKTSGYVAPKEELNTCRKGCIHTAHLLFNKDSIKQSFLENGFPSAGQGMLKEISGGLRSAKNREFSWAFLESTNDSGTFLVISVHLNNGETKLRKGDRTKVGKGMKKWADDLRQKAGLPDIPVILMGDFNSYKSREPKGMSYQLEQSGFVDTYKAALNISELSKRSTTVQYSNTIDGWPTKPILRNNPARIDYIMYLGENLQADTYTAMPHILENGEFDPDYHASDHIMISSIINFNFVKE